MTDTTIQIDLVRLTSYITYYTLNATVNAILVFQNSVSLITQIYEPTVFISFGAVINIDSMSINSNVYSLRVVTFRNLTTLPEIVVNQNPRPIGSSIDRNQNIDIKNKVNLVFQKTLQTYRQKQQQINSFSTLEKVYYDEVLNSNKEQTDRVIILNHLVNNYKQ